MKTLLTAVVAFATLLSNISAQKFEISDSRFEAVEAHNQHACASKSIRTEMIASAKANVATLLATRKVQIDNRKVVQFQWPMVYSGDMPMDSYYSISALVDHDANFPSSVMDYNCGQKSYDLSGGYNHPGTDLFLFPFRWYMMDNDMVSAIAPASGTIVYKVDGFQDHNCNYESPDWNAIGLLHADGTVTFYGHLKANSLTQKIVGDAVQLGEFLGTVGSSGFSNGPHLHFEVYEDISLGLEGLIDPFSGPCNEMNTLSWWADQQPYLSKNVNAVLTHSSIPVVNGCSDDEQTNMESCFAAGQPFVVAAYLRDMGQNDNINFTIEDVTGYPVMDWTFTYQGSNLPASYVYWEITIPSSASEGQYTINANFDGKLTTTNFNITDNCQGIILSLSELQLHAEITNNGVLLNASCELDENAYKNLRLERSTSGTAFLEIASLDNVSDQSYLDIELLNGTVYYRLKIVLADGSVDYSDIIIVETEAQKVHLAYHNSTVEVVSELSCFAHLSIYNTAGQLLYGSALQLDANTVKSIQFESKPNQIYIAKLEINGKTELLKFCGY